MTLTESARSLLAYSEQFDLDRLLADQLAGPGTEEAPNAGYGYLPDVLESLKATLQELWAIGPNPIGRDDWSEIINPPTEITLTFSEGGNYAQCTPSAWMKNCSIVIPGHSVGFDVITGISQYLDAINVRVPFTFSDTVVATVYHDCISLGSEWVRLLNDPVVRDQDILTNRHSFSDLYRDAGREVRDFGRARRAPTRVNRKYSATYPQYYWANHNQPPIRLYVHPLPETSTVITASALKAPPVWTIADIVADPEGEQPETDIPVPSDWVELYFMPIAKARYSSSPFFKNNDVIARFEMQAKTAREALARMRPQAASTFFRYPGI